MVSNGVVHVILTESRTRRSVRGGNTSVRAGFADSTYTPANNMADGATRCQSHKARLLLPYFHPISPPNVEFSTCLIWWNLNTQIIKIINKVKRRRH